MLTQDRNHTAITPQYSNDLYTNIICSERDGNRSYDYSYVLVYSPVQFHPFLLKYLIMYLYENNQITTQNIHWKRQENKLSATQNIHWKRQENKLSAT